MVAFVLASASPRRRQFLEELGFRPEIVPADIDETPRLDEEVSSYVRRLAAEKARAVAVLRPDAVVLAADTIVTIEGQLLGKPAGAQAFSLMMQKLSGRTHQVLTAAAVCSPGKALREVVASTDVTFRQLSAAEIDWYWTTGEPRDKAGGYALQGLGGAFVRSIAGSHSNVIGLPLVETLELLQEVGIPSPWQAR
jgi:septum formation protein